MAGDRAGAGCDRIDHALIGRRGRIEGAGGEMEQMIGEARLSREQLAALFAEDREGLSADR